MHTIRDDVRRADAFLALLLATDVLFIIGHIIFMVMHLLVWDTPGLLDNIPSDYSIVMERSFAETFQYIKTYWVVIMFLWLVLKTREFGFLAWALAFLYLGLDDLLEIHEEVGNTIAIRWDFPADILGQRPRDLGEIAVLATAGLVLGALIAIAYFTGSDRFKQVSRTLIGLAGIFVVFGIGFDALHIVFLERSLGAIFGLIEDGGELIVLSLIAWFVWGIVTGPLSTREEQRAPVTAQARRARHR